MASSGFDYSKIPPGYYDEVFHRGRGVQSAWHVAKFDAVRSEISGSGRLLDFGCGPGTFLGTLEGDRSVLGVDLSEEQIAYAQRRYGAPNRRFECVKDGRLPYDDGEFDAVVLIEVIEHLEPVDVQQIFGEAWRVLKPEGRIVVTTPNYRSLWPILEWFVNRLGKLSYADQHINRYVGGRLRRELDQSGFANVRVKSFQRFAPFLAAASWSAFKATRQQSSSPLSSLFPGFLLMGVGQRV